MDRPPDLSILTPSLNDLGYLKRACASVADQEGPAVEHIVLDGGSTDGSIEWLRSRKGIVPVIGMDAGIYDALNSGLARARGRWIGILNCDEQYLPGALQAVHDAAVAHPETGILTGDFLVVRPDGTALCHRREIPARALYIRSSYLYTFTCAMFFRRETGGPPRRFDPRFTAAGDEEFVLRLLKEVRPLHIRRYLSAFTDRPGAVGLSDAAAAETRRLRGRDPVWFRSLRPLFRVLRHLEKGVSGGYRRAERLHYHLYTGAGEGPRTGFMARDVTWRWGRR